MTERKTSVIVTGASGFIGSHLIDKLLDSHYSVIAITRKTPELSQRLDNRLVWCEWDRVEDFLANSKEDKPIAIIHLATAYGRDGSDYVESEMANVIRPLQLLELAIKYKIQKFINTDSFFSKDEFNYQYMRPYVLTKRTFCRWGRIVSDDNGIKFINMRLEHVYGPRDGGSKFIPYLMKAFSENHEHIELTDCLQKRDFIYIDDVVSAYLTVLASNETPSFAEYQVGLGYSIELRQMVESIRGLYEKSTSKIIYGARKQRQNEIMDSFASNENLIELGWRPKFNLTYGVSMLLF